MTPAYHYGGEIIVMVPRPDISKPSLSPETAKLCPEPSFRKY